MSTKASIKALSQASAQAIPDMNAFLADVFQTRGGRLGSGMGLLLEGLWGYWVNQQFDAMGVDLEIGWISGHAYNDFALVWRDRAWDPDTGAGEVLRVEAKSMVNAAEESKAHFDALQREIGAHDQLLVLGWDWVAASGQRNCPEVQAHFLGSATAVAVLRDTLHLARGGRFVLAGQCPDGCPASACTHLGEPLNAKAKRERLTGPEASRVSQSTSHANNFGGLVRMLKAGNATARGLRDQALREPTARRYAAFIDAYF